MYIYTYTYIPYFDTNLPSWAARRVHPKLPSFIRCPSSFRFNPWIPRRLRSGRTGTS